MRIQTNAIITKMCQHSGMSSNCLSPNMQEQAHKEGQTLIDRAKLAAATVHNELPQRPHIC